MEVKKSKLDVMLQEHKGRGGELEYLWKGYLKKLKKELSEEDYDTVKEALRVGLKYYRHVGAIWAVEGILNGTEYDWGLDAGGT